MLFLFIDQNTIMKTYFNLYTLHFLIIGSDWKVFSWVVVRRAYLVCSSSIFISNSIFFFFPSFCFSVEHNNKRTGYIDLQANGSHKYDNAIFAPHYSNFEEGIYWIKVTREFKKFRFESSVLVSVVKDNKALQDFIKNTKDHKVLQFAKDYCSSQKWFWRKKTKRKKCIKVSHSNEYFNFWIPPFTASLSWFAHQNLQAN